MKRIVILLSLVSLLTVVSCSETPDTRYFAPVVEFASDAFTVASSAGGLDVEIVFSTPAQIDFSLSLQASGQLREGEQFSLSAKEIAVKAGATGATTRLTLVDDEIWDESAWIDLTLVPGLRYTVNPDGHSTARVTVTKEINIPVFRLVSPAEELETNPYLAETLHFRIDASKASDSETEVEFTFGELVAGTDYLIDGASSAKVTFPSGSLQKEFDLKILKKDISGYDQRASFAIKTKKRVYVAASGQSSVEIHLSDPAVDFAALQKTAALNGGAGHQIRQAIRKPGDWDGNTAVDMSPSATGSNYLRSHRNLYASQWLCLANSPGSNMFRLTEFFPDLLYPNDITILDYGSASNTRTFSPCDSIFRFVCDKGSRTEGALMLDSPRTFIAFTGPRADWDGGTSPNKVWQLDSKATGGNILLSTNATLTGRLEVKLMKLEGRFNLASSDSTMVFTAWFQCDSPSFMNNIDPSAIETEQEDGLWKVQYKLWPRL